jgi:hypothetical protein
MLFQNSIVDYASNALVLSISPMDSLSIDKQKEKETFIIRRNRILEQLEKSSTNLGNEEQTILKTEICSIRTFFGPTEQFTHPSRSLGFFVNTTDKGICATIISSLKPGSKGLTEKERLKNEALREAIFNAAALKARNEGPRVEKNLEAFFAALNIERTTPSIPQFG